MGSRLQADSFDTDKWVLFLLQHQEFYVELFQICVKTSLLFGVRKYMALMQEGIIIGSYGVVCVLVLDSM